MNSVDQIIEAYKRGLEDGRRGSDNKRPADPYGGWIRRQQSGNSTGNSQVNTPMVTCELERQTPSCSGDVR